MPTGLKWHVFRMSCRSAERLYVRLELHMPTVELRANNASGECVRFEDSERETQTVVRCEKPKRKTSNGKSRATISLQVASAETTVEFHVRNSFQRNNPSNSFGWIHLGAPFLPVRARFGLRLIERSESASGHLYGIDVKLNVRRQETCIYLFGLEIHLNARLETAADEASDSFLRRFLGRGALLRPRIEMTHRNVLSTLDFWRVLCPLAHM